MIYLIVPCFNESERLRLEVFQAYARESVTILFADDGSRDDTATRIESYCRKNSQMHLFRLTKNGGKAVAVQQAFQYLEAHFSLQNDDWIGYWDADLSTPLSEVERMLRYAITFYQEPLDAIWGSRVYRLGSRIERSALRHYLGRVFATVIALALKVGSYDSQCGAKLFRAPAARKVFSEPFLSRWIFDVEILLRLQEDRVVEYPLVYWADVPGSKVKVLKELFRVAWDIFKIRRRYIGRGHLPQPAWISRAVYTRIEGTRKALPEPAERLTNRG